jgi:hypothetical protein
LEPAYSAEAKRMSVERLRELSDWLRDWDLC